MFDYVEAQAGPRRADIFISGILDRCRELEIFPERGIRRDDLSPGLRTLGYRRRITIAFEVEPAAVIVLGIYYGGQDFEAALRGDG